MSIVGLPGAIIIMLIPHCLASQQGHIDGNIPLLWWDHVGLSCVMQIL